MCIFILKRCHQLHFLHGRGKHLFYISVWVVFTLIFFHSQSQSEFDVDGDMSSNEVVKQRAKDPMRPKSPRHMRTNSGDVPKPGALERSVNCGTQ